MANTAGIGLRMWKSMQAWSSVRAAGVQRAEGEASTAISAFQTARQNQIAGQATLITKITQKRVLAEAQTKLKAAAATINGTTSKSTTSTGQVDKVA